MTMSPQDKADNNAVRRLLERTRGKLILLADPENNLYLLPAQIDIGTIEYQLSNGLEGRRSHSEDYQRLSEAVERFENLAKGGGFSSQADHEEAAAIEKEEIAQETNRVLEAVDYMGLTTDQFQALLDDWLDDVDEEALPRLRVYTQRRQVRHLIKKGKSAQRMIDSIEDYLTP